MCRVDETVLDESVFCPPTHVFDCCQTRARSTLCALPTLFQDDDVGCQADLPIGSGLHKGGPTHEEATFNLELASLATLTSFRSRLAKRRVAV